jgi:hypothetical protein
MFGLLAVTACAGTISPRTVRDELVRQAGTQPAHELELTMGRLTTALLKRVVGPLPDGTLPLAGLTAIELAVYGVPVGAGPVDFSEITPWGWENVVRYRDEDASALVMIRGGRETIRDLALVVAAREEILYGRLRGRLPTTLPGAIRDAVSGGGVAAIKQQLLEVAGQPEG